MTRPGIRTLVTVVFYAAVIAFLVIYLLSIDLDQLDGVSANAGIVVLASLLGLGGRFFGTFIWLRVLRGLGAVVPRRDVPLLGWVYARAWMGRYIPGTAPWIVGKIFFASQHGVSRVKLAVGSLVEGGVQIIVLVLISTVFILLDPRLSIVGPELRIALVAVAVIGLVVLTPPVFNRLFGLVLRVIRRGPIAAEDRVDLRTILLTGGLYTVSSVITGVSTFGIILAVVPSAGIDDLLFIVAAVSIAGAAGMLAIFVPSGIGVREGVLVGLLVAVMPPSAALTAAIVTRLWSVLLDLVFLAVSGGVQAITARARR